MPIRAGKGKRLFLPALAAVLSCTTALHAQDAPYRPALVQLRAALDSQDTQEGIDRLASRWNAEASRPTKRVGNGYIQLRRGMVANNRSTLESAWATFDQVVVVHPDWPYALLGLAISAYEINARGYKVPGTYDGSVGLTHYEGASKQVARLLEQEPGFVPALDWIANSLLTAEGDRAQPVALTRAIGRAIDSSAGADPRLELIVARADRLEGNAPESMRRLAAYLRQGGDSGVGKFEMARSLASMDSLAAGAAIYLAGAQVRSTAARDIYRLDLSWIANSHELARYDSLTIDSVGGFITRFWALRDAREFTAPGGRLQEHLRRWAYVNEHFRIADPGLADIIRHVNIPNPNEQCAGTGPMSLEDYDYVQPSRPNDFRSGQRIFDHRAVVYMRHGEPLYRFGGSTAGLSVAATDRGSLGSTLSKSPNMSAYDPFVAHGASNGGVAGAAGDVDVRIQTPAVGGGLLIPVARATAPDPTRNETWVYMMEGQLRAFTFMGHTALGRANPTTLIVYLPPSFDVMLRLSTLSPAYARAASIMQAYSSGTSSAIELTCHPEYRTVIAEQQHGADIAVHTDSYLHLFANTIGTAMQLAAVGQPALGTGELVAAIGLRIEDLQESAEAGDSTRAAYVVRVRIAAIDSMTGDVTTSDTVRRFMAARSQHGWLTFLATLPIKRGFREVRVSVQQSEDRGATSVSSIQPAGASFAASDLVLGTEAGAATWQHDGAVIAVTPFSAFVAGSNLLIYQELYELTPGGKYRTTVSLRRTGETKVSSALDFTDEPFRPTLSTSRLLTLDRVKAGSYDLIVEVEEVSSGRRVHRERTITVTQP